MLSDANFLILDEPTNHLDMISKEILENALNHYEGTVFYVSHDRYFINKTAHRILELSNQALTNYLGNYDYYLEKKIPSSISTAPAWKNTPAANEGDSDLSSLETEDRKSVASGKSVPLCLDSGCRRIIKQNNETFWT